MKKDHNPSTAARGPLLVVIFVPFIVLLLWYTIAYQTPWTTPEKTFYEIAKEVGTDKVDQYQYHCIYEDSLAPYRHVTGLKILEIGLNCPRHNNDKDNKEKNGTGTSMTLWDTYFENVTIHFLEQDKKCGEKWFNAYTGQNKPVMTYGDQAALNLLQKLVNDHGPWDIIVDNGRGSIDQKVITFNTLFSSALKPGGVYFVEDLLTSHDPNFYGNDVFKQKLSSGVREQTVRLIGHFFALSLGNDAGMSAKIGSQRCCDEICGFAKMTE